MARDGTARPSSRARCATTVAVNTRIAIVSRGVGAEPKVNDSSWSPFKPIKLLWIPISLPAIGLGMAASLLFYLVNLLFAAMSPAVHGANEAIALFGENGRSVILAFSLIEREGGNPSWLFGCQLLTAIALWSTFGLALARCIALRLTRDEYVGIGEALVFGFRHATTAALYPLIVLGCMLALLILNGLLGAAMQIPWLGSLFFLLMPVAYISSGLLLVLFLTGVGGAGMVVGAVAVERRGTLDAWGKALNYIFARPLHFVVYLVLTKVVIVDLLIHYTLERRVLHEWTDRSLSPLWHNDRFESILSHSDSVGGLDSVSAFLHRLFGAGLTLTLVGFATACVFSAFTGMFLILRSDVDGIDTSDIDLEDEVVDPVPQRVLPEAGCATAGAEEKPAAADDGEPA